MKEGKKELLKMVEERKTLKEDRNNRVKRIKGIKWSENRKGKIKKEEEKG